MATKILVLEDEIGIRSFIALNLKHNGYEVVEAETGEEAVRIMEKNQGVKMALLDVMLPGELNGYDVCAKLRRMHPQMGIIMLAALGQEENKIDGLQRGADDYIVKPFSPKELIARLEAVYRRVKYMDEDVDIVLKPFTLSASKMKFYKGDQEIEVTPTEFSILKLFIEKHDVAISRDELLNTIWGRNYCGDIKVVDVNIRRIRSKIEEDPSKPKYIQTDWGHGYCFKGGEES